MPNGQAFGGLIMTEIYLIRHTQAEGNLYQMMQGHWDGGVTPLGLRQIDALAERFRDIKLDRVFSSDLYRAMLTAQALTRFDDLEVETDERFKEINVGSWETQFFANVVWDDPERFDNFIHHPDDFYLEGAETYAQVGQRGLEALREKAEENDGRVIGIASHGITIRCIMSRLTGIPLDNVSDLPIFQNTAVTHLYYDGGEFTVDYMNDISHLDDSIRKSSFKSPGLRDECVDPRDHRDFYIECYADSWENAHGSLAGFNGEEYFAAACRHHDENPEAVAIAFDNDKPVGIIDLDTTRLANEGCGWISLIYLKKEYRHRCCGIQLLARAMFRYDRMGRDTLRLTVAEENTEALDFYARWGFYKKSETRGAVSKLLLMEKKLRGERHGYV